MGQLNFVVGGMSCRRCVREVTALVRDVPGVETVSASAGDRTVRLSGSMQRADVLASFAGTTYQPRLDGAQPAPSDGDLDGDVDGDSAKTATGQPSP